MLRAGTPKVGEIAWLEAAGTEFAGQQSHQGQPHPLADAKGPKKLAFRVFNGRGDRVRGGESQAYTST